MLYKLFTDGYTAERLKIPIETLIKLSPNSICLIFLF